MQAHPKRRTRKLHPRQSLAAVFDRPRSTSALCRQASVGPCGSDDVVPAEECRAVFTAFWLNSRVLAGKHVND
jgi:hypothetical protein